MLIVWDARGQRPIISAARAAKWQQERCCSHATLACCHIATVAAHTIAELGLLPDAWHFDPCGWLLAMETKLPGHQKATEGLYAATKDHTRRLGRPSLYSVAYPGARAARTWSRDNCTGRSDCGRIGERQLVSEAATHAAACQLHACMVKKGDGNTSLTNDLGMQMSLPQRLPQLGQQCRHIHSQRRAHSVSRMPRTMTAPGPNGFAGGLAALDVETSAASLRSPSCRSGDDSASFAAPAQSKLIP